jgi:hypothetical protein
VVALAAAQRLLVVAADTRAAVALSAAEAVVLLPVPAAARRTTKTACQKSDRFEGVRSFPGNWKKASTPKTAQARFTPQQEVSSSVARRSIRFDPGSAQKYSAVPFWK